MDLTKLESGRLVFLPFEESDFDCLYSVLGNDEVCLYLPGDKAYTKEQVSRVLQYFIKTFINEKKNLHYKVLLKEDNTFIGYCGCSYIEEYKSNEIEYFLNPKFYGNKFASEMAKKMKEVAIELGLNYLVGLADINNIPSQRILEKIGYQYKKVVEHWGATLKYYELTL